CFSDDVAPDMLEVVYFTYVMKGVLLNGIIDTFRSKVKEASYKEMNNIISTGITEIAEIVADEVMTKDDIICMLGIRDLGTTFSSAAKTSLLAVFREVFGLECIHKIAKSIPENEKEEPLKVAGRLITGIDVDVVTDIVIFGFMQVVKNSHETRMKLLQTLAKARKRQLLSLQHAIMVGALLLPRVADIEIGMKSIEFDMENNRLRLGQELCSGRHSRLYDYTGGWHIPTDNPGGYIIRVMKRESGPAWNDTVVSLYHNSSLKQNDSLLAVVGWWMPDADTLYILMPKMEQSLDKTELSPEQIVQVVLDIAKGVHAIHDSGFSYNNLKAKNIL
ncbi:dual serine/threonine and tyrosine protein kinase-like, partial [Saccoglossus kowalevskii]|uniref:Uncharacterized protein LOC102803300 n=1 Tax=Saccoglossus kowalevskii TaxID=10224 RepID=A0ABM0MB33_SACKO